MCACNVGLRMELFGQGVGVTESVLLTFYDLKGTLQGTLTEAECSVWCSGDSGESLMEWKRPQLEWVRSALRILFILVPVSQAHSAWLPGGRKLLSWPGGWRAYTVPPAGHRPPFLGLGYPVLSVTAK